VSWERLRRFRVPETAAFHLALLVLTLFSTTFFGALLFAPTPPGISLTAAVGSSGFWRSGLSFSVPLLAILGSHELGHYFMCRKYGLPATLPYFIPAPVGIGTFGAVIRIKAPIGDKKTLFDVGVAGPLTGFVVALPILFYGIGRFTPIPSHTVAARGTILFNYPPLIVLLQKFTLGHAYTTLEVHESPVFMAAWFGLFVTALNLLPLSQLDGGHVLYAVAGKLQRPIALALFGGLVVLSFFWIGWLVWAAIVLFLGIFHPPIEDEAVPLDFGRKCVAALTLLIFLGCFTPVPIQMVGGWFG
jgi:membrane-associated protease RseP (regulator of RpoE activity)